MIISSAPDILYAEDPDGDGRADRREVLFTGFAESNPQHRVNGFAFGLDGWVYAADADGGRDPTGDDAAADRGPRGRTSASDPTRGSSSRRAAGRSSAAAETTGATGSATTIRTGAGTSSSTTPTSAATRCFALPTTRTGSLDPDTRVFPASRTLARFNDPGRPTGRPRPTAPSPTATTCSAPTSPRASSSASRCTTSSTGVVLEPDGPTFRGRRAEGEERVRVPRLDRPLVPADDDPHRAGRGPLGRRHVPRRHRASRVDPRGLAAPARPPGRPRPGPHLPRLPGRSAAAADPAARQARHGRARRRARQPERLAARHGPAAPDAPERRSGHRSPPRRWPRRADRPEARVQALWTLAGLGGLDADGRPPRPGRRASRGPPRRDPDGAVGCCRTRPRSARRSCRLPATRRPASGSPRRWRWATGRTRGPAGRWRRSPCATAATPGSGRPSSASPRRTPRRS